MDSTIGPEAAVLDQNNTVLLTTNMSVVLAPVIVDLVETNLPENDVPGVVNVDGTIDLIAAAGGRRRKRKAAPVSILMRKRLDSLLK